MEVSPMSESAAPFEPEVQRVEFDGATLVCHHPREGIWCCCAEDEATAAQCRCAHDLPAAVRAWVRDERGGE
jgi:hypothetical protein